MPRYFFHVRNGDSLIQDLEGIDLPDLDAARIEALEGARSLLSETVRTGGVLDGQRFEIVDESGQVLDTLSFRDALRLK